MYHFEFVSYTHKPKSSLIPRNFTQSVMSIMASRFTEIIKLGPCKPKKESDIPMEILESILSLLNLRNNIRASAVCRRWLAAAISVRRSNRSPLLMYFPKHGDLHEFYDPSNRRMHHLELPELHDSRILYAKGSWLLLVRRTTFVVFFFCPYSREMLTLPRIRPGHHMVAFSAPPTSPDCIVFAVYHLLTSNIIVGTCRPGANKWDAFSYNSDQHYMSRTWNQVIFSNARFYCMNVSGQVGVFNPERNTWGVYYTPAPKYMSNLSFHIWWSAKFMAEHDGEIYVVCCSAAANPVIYRLDRVNEVWAEMKSLGRMSIFANAQSSIIGTDFVGRVAGKMAGSVVFSKILLHGRQCVMYSPRRGRYYPAKRFHNWNEEEPLDSVWIDAPDDASIFL